MRSLRMRRFSHPILWGVLSMCVAGVFDAARRAEAIPAFARQFDAKCSQCHSPVPPRLNNLGLVVRRMGWRLPDEENGKLILKNLPARNPFEVTSLISIFSVRDTKELHGDFQLEEFDLRSAGNLGNKASYLTHFTWDNIAKQWNWQFGEGQYNIGTAEHAIIIRAGRLEPLFWEKGNEQSITVSTPLVFNEIVPAGSFAGFTLGQSLVGLEVGGALNHLGTEGGEITSTNASLAVYNGVTSTGDTATSATSNYKDLLAQVVHQWGEANTIGALVYRGTGLLTADEAAALNTQPPTLPSRDRFYRYGLFGNYRVGSGTDLLGAYLRGTDHSSGAGGAGHVPSDGYYAEVDQGFGEKARAAAVLRWDHFTPDTHHSSSTDQGWTTGLIYRPQDNVILRFEFQALHGASAGASATRDFTLQAILAY
jgi:hypothetical protein